MSVQGAKGIQRALEAHRKAVGRGMEKGLYLAGLFLQRESQKIVPVDKGPLRESADTRMEGEGLRANVIVSYGTDYAIYVHEMVENRHKPGKQAKFLEQPFREKRDRMREILVEAMRGETL